MIDESNQTGRDSSLHPDFKIGAGRPKLREMLEVIHEDNLRETILIKRLSNCDMIKWIDLGFDKQFLVFRSVELGSATVPVAGVNQSWFDSLTQDSAFAVVENALALNHSPVQKK